MTLVSKTLEYHDESSHTYITCIHDILREIKRYLWKIINFTTKL